MVAPNRAGRGTSAACPFVLAEARAATYGERMRWFSLVSAIVGLTTMGCVQSQSCTEIGCTDQLTVNFAGTIGMPYSVTLQLEGKAASFTCDVNGVRNAMGVMVQSCDNTSFVLIGAPASAMVQVTCGNAPDDGGTVDCTGTFSPTYTSTRPNGPSCPPTCRQGTVTLK